MAEKPMIEISYPEGAQADQSGKILIRTLPPGENEKLPTLQFTVRVFDPGSGRAVVGEPVFASFYVDGSGHRATQLIGSGRKTDSQGTIDFECPAHPDHLFRTNLKIECLGTALKCGLLPPFAPESPGRLTRVDGAVTSEHADFVSGSINLDDEPPVAVIVPPDIPPPPEPLTVNDLMLAEEREPEPVPITRRTEIGVPVLTAPMGTNPEAPEEDGIVSAPMPESHIGDTIPHELEVPTRAAPRPAEVFPESIRQLESGDPEPKGQAPVTPDPLADFLQRLEEALEQTRELRAQFESSIRDEVELQRQIKTSHATLLSFPAKADAVLEKYRADIGEETREVKGIKQTLDLLVENFDAKVTSAIESITQKQSDAEHSISETLARLKTELERTREEAITAIKQAGEAERRSMVDVSNEQKEQIRRTAPPAPLAIVPFPLRAPAPAAPIVMPPVVPFRLAPPPAPAKWHKAGQKALLAAVVVIGAGSIAALIVDFIAHL